MILSLVAAVGAMTSLFYVRKTKPSPAATAPPKPPETPPLGADKQETPETAEKEEQATPPTQEEAPTVPPTPEAQTPQEESATSHEAPLETPPATETPSS